MPMTATCSAMTSGTSSSSQIRSMTTWPPNFVVGGHGVAWMRACLGAVPPVVQPERAGANGARRRSIEQVHADLKGSALAHLPSGVFTANAAWLVLAVIAFDLTRAAGTLAAPELARATTATLRRKLLAVPARVATSARRVTLHLPAAWPWETAWTTLFTRVSDPPLEHWS